jgi:hypothetical protein
MNASAAQTPRTRRPVQSSPRRRSRPTVMVQRSAPLPTWLRSLLLLQRSSATLLWLAGFAVLSLYGWSAYSQRVWGESYNKLERMHRDEPQLTLARELMNQQLAADAESKNSGLTNGTPGQGIVYLESATPRTIDDVPVDPAAVQPAAPIESLEMPLGY